MTTNMVGRHDGCHRRDGDGGDGGNGCDGGDYQYKKTRKKS